MSVVNLFSLKGQGLFCLWLVIANRPAYEASLLSIKPSVVLLRAKCGEIVLLAQIVAGFGLNL